MRRRSYSKHDLRRLQTAEELDRAAIGSKKRTRYPQSQLFDQMYQEDHADEIQKAEGEGKRRRGAF